MLRRLFAFLAILIFSTPIWAETKIQKNTSTVIIENATELSDNHIVLDGAWDYYKSNFVHAKEFYPEQKVPKGELVVPPHFFEPNVKHGTYHCRVEGLLPNKRYAMSVYGRILSCYRIWCNRQLVGVAGFLEKEGTISTAAQTSEIIDLPSDEQGVIDIVIQVANHELNNGGLVQTLVFTERNNLEKKYIRLIYFSIFVIAFLSMLIFYNLILMLMNRKPLVYFSLVLTSIFFIFSTATSGISIFNLFFPEAPFWLEFRLPVLLLALDICTYIFYMSASRRISGKSGVVLYIASIIIVLLVAIVPLKIFEQFKTVFILLSISMLAFILILSFKFLLKKNSKSPNLFSLDVLLYNFDIIINTGILVAIFYDFIISQKKVELIHSCFAFKLGILLFGFMQCAIPAFRRYFTHYRIQKSSERFELNNNLLARFIPEQVLKLMNADDITKITLGSCQTLDTMILYIEIGYFKNLAESLDSKELFEIITKYYKEVAPIIRSFGGYIAKYMRHGCLAIFTERNDTPIRCAMKMQEKMSDVRRILRKTHKADISIGIAIHTGKIACGVIGSEKRFDSITFSPEINTAIQIGAQTSKTHAKTFISEDAMTYCRTYTDCMYEGHFLLIDGKNILVYSAMPFKEFDKNYDGGLELVEETESEEVGKTNEV